MLTSHTLLEASNCTLQDETCPVPPAWAACPQPVLLAWQKHSPVCKTKATLCGHVFVLSFVFHFSFSLDFRFQAREVLVISANVVLKTQILFIDGMGNLLYFCVLSFLSPHFFLSSPQKVKAYLHLCIYQLLVMMGP